MPHPESENVHIIPTSRDPADGLALSSRNTYLSQDGRRVAPTLYQALRAAESAWKSGFSKSKCIEAAQAVVDSRIAQAQSRGLDVKMKLDYIEMNDANTFDVLDPEVRKEDRDLVILSGALYVDKTRLIDNILLGNTEKVLS